MAKVVWVVMDARKNLPLKVFTNFADAKMYVFEKSGEIGRELGNWDELDLTLTKTSYGNSKYIYTKMVDLEENLDYEDEGDEMELYGAYCQSEADWDYVTIDPINWQEPGYVCIKKDEIDSLIRELKIIQKLDEERWN